MNISRRSFLAAAPLLAQSKTPKNVVLVLLDDLGWKDFGCYGSKMYPTPNINELAKESTQFNRFYAACPVCSPTRASILTGKYPTRTGVTDWIPGAARPARAPLDTPPTRNELALDEKTIAEYLKPLGYATASFGKWHLGGPGFSPLEQGFDLNVGGTHLGQPNSYLAPFTMPGLQDALPRTELTGYLTKLAAKWVADQAAAKKPFFLYLPHFAVHTPLGSDLEIISRYRDSGALNSVYAAMIDCVDESIATLRRQLVRSKVDGDTLFILTSDNGGITAMTGKPITDNRPLRAEKGYLYEGGIRVPCLIRDPKRPAAVVNDPACSIDLLPTIFQWLGQPAPKDIDGTPLFGRKSAPTYYWHYPHYHGGGGKPSGAIMDGDWKLVEDFETSRMELYNLKDDIGEAKDLSAQRPAEALDLHKRLQSWRNSTNALMPTPKKIAASSPAPAGTSARTLHSEIAPR